jgi:hypothetical protein
MKQLIEHILIFQHKAVPFILHLQCNRLLILEVLADIDAFRSYAFDLRPQTISLHSILVVLPSAYTML